jgi:hypothetical protein
MLETIKPWTQCGATSSSFDSATMHLKKVAPTSVLEPMTMMTRVQTQPSKIPRQTRTHCMLLCFTFSQTPPQSRRDFVPRTLQGTAQHDHAPSTVATANWQLAKVPRLQRRCITMQSAVRQALCKLDQMHFAKQVDNGHNNARSTSKPATH